MDSAPVHHILVIDDEPTVTDFLAEFLTEAGYRVSTAADGDQGLAIVRREPVDLAIVDLLMPVKDGLETLQEIQQIAPQVELFVISGWYPDPGTDLLTATVDLYASRRFQKPFKPSELLDAIVEALASSSPRGEAAPES